MKTFARQISPEYQESPLFLGEDFFRTISPFVAIGTIANTFPQPLRRCGKC